MESTSTLFIALQEAAIVCRSATSSSRVRRLLAEIDLLRAAVAISAIEPAPEEDRSSLAQLVFNLRDEALAFDAAAAMMD